MFYSSWNGFLPFLPSCLPPCLPSVLVFLSRCAFSFSSCLVSFHFSCLPFTPFFLRFFVPSFIAFFLPSPPLLAVISFWYEAICLFDAIYISTSSPRYVESTSINHFSYINQTKLLTIKTVSTIDLAANEAGCLGRGRWTWVDVWLLDHFDKALAWWPNVATPVRPACEFQWAVAAWRKFHGNQPLDQGL